MKEGRNRSELLELEERYAYYRRCQTVRKNGVQCRAPALKGERICCKHQLQKEMQERWERQRAALQLPEQFQEPASVLRALHSVGQALIDGRVDGKVGRKIIWELSFVLWRQAAAERMIGRLGVRWRKNKPEMTYRKGIGARKCEVANPRRRQ